MDTDLLVDAQIADGEMLIRQLIRDRFAVAVAFWVKRSEEGLWHLYIASPSVAPANSGDALATVYAALDKIGKGTVSPVTLTLLNDRDPIARDAAWLRDRYPSKEVKRHRGQRLGNLATVELCIYPRRFPFEVRVVDGRWQVLISKGDDVWLTCESEDDARAIAAAPVLEYESLAQLKSDAQFTAELERTADALEKYHMSFGSRFFRWRAQELKR